MTTRGTEGREAITHYKVTRRIDSPFGKFTLLEVNIETGRTHQIRVHLSSLGHAIVGDALYGASRELRGQNATITSLTRNFLHAGALRFAHPINSTELSLERPIPAELQKFLARLEAS